MTGYGRSGRIIGGPGFHGMACVAGRATFDLPVVCPIYTPDKRTAYAGRTGSFSARRGEHLHGIGTNCPAGKVKRRPEMPAGIGD